MSSSKQYWLLIFSCCLLCPPHYTQSTPLQRPTKGRGPSHGDPPCPHSSIAELIRTSPVILKALGARIFTDADLSALQTMQLADNNIPSYNNIKKKTNSGHRDDGEKLEWQNAHNNFLMPATLEQPTIPWRSRSTAATSSTAGGASPATATMSSSSSDKHANSDDMNVIPESILISLTPETIYKGASLLKMTPSGESASRPRSSNANSYGNSGAGGSSAAESAYQYEGQLNATLQPLACFSDNVLRILPTELIVFGKLVTLQQQQQQLQLPLPLQQNAQQQNQQQQHSTIQSDILHISINGLHRWTPQFENHIWKHLGWDDWSDFTLCSVTCGKGVQQRFRRCLLDNPLVNLSMQRNAVSMDVDDNDEDSEDDDDGGVANAATFDYDEHDELHVEYVKQKAVPEQMLYIKTTDSYDNSASQVTTITTTTSTTSAATTNQIDADDLTSATEKLKEKIGLSDAMLDMATTWAQESQQAEQHQLSFKTNYGSVNSMTPGAIEDETMRVFVTSSGRSSDESDSSPLTHNNLSNNSNTTNDNNNKNSSRKHHKRRKATKSFSTLFCEGYNIEQRNCNAFECSDDISDLLKFYKKFPTLEEATSAANVATAVSMTAIDFNNSTTRTDTTGDSATISLSTVAAPGVGATAYNAPSTSTPANMGYIKNWRNALNFTLMITLRIKNDSKITATIFSIRNSTHNLYMEPDADGLRLYLERDNTTEMLPLKFNLYDYRWHQVAISIQNGDFISIYIDCSWTNSFVVSKRLFSLPLDADVEIGRGFNGELQQLLVLPNNQERQQCSSKRTSINEVKRYIIDTFIDDYAN